MIIVVGCGRVGRDVVTELRRQRQPEITVVDIRPERLELATAAWDGAVRGVLGDAAEDDVLRAAGIETATGLVSTMARDQDNLFVCLAAGLLNPSLRVVSRVEEQSNASKFTKVGVRAVVSPAEIGGDRIANSMVRPEVVAFADALQESDEKAPSLVELTVAKGSPAAGRRLRDLGLQRVTGAVVLGLRTRRARYFDYHPAPSQRLKAGGVVLALGDPDEIAALRRLLQQDGS